MAWDLIEKSGNPANGGYDYDENNMEYDVDLDLDTGISVLYNSLGEQSSPFINITKS